MRTSRRPEPATPAALRALSLPRVGARHGWAGLNTSAERLLALLEGHGETWTLTSGGWSVLKLLALARPTVGAPGTLDLWTWTVSRRAAERLTTWAREGVDVRAVVDTSLRRRQPRYAAVLEAGLGDRLRWASLHAKVAALRGPAGALVIAGSGNLNFCRRAELVILSRDAGLAAWVATITDRLFAALAAGVPAERDEALADRVARVFPVTDAARPAWAEGLPGLVAPAHGTRAPRRDRAAGRRGTREPGIVAPAGV
jgi:hypothetical protein